MRRWQQAAVSGRVATGVRNRSSSSTQSERRAKEIGELGVGEVSDSGEIGKIPAIIREEKRIRLCV